MKFLGCIFSVTYILYHGPRTAVLLEYALNDKYQLRLLGLLVIYHICSAGGIYFVSVFTLYLLFKLINPCVGSHSLRRRVLKYRIKIKFILFHQQRLVGL